MDMMTPSYIVFFSGGGEGFSIPELVIFLAINKKCIQLHRFSISYPSVHVNG